MPATYYRLTVRNDRKKYYRVASDIVRFGQLYPANATVVVDVSEKQKQSIKVCRSLEILDEQVIPAIENPVPTVIGKPALTEPEEDVAKEEKPKGGGRGKKETQ